MGRYSVADLAIGGSGERVSEGGAKARARTGDRTIFSRELYQLSYLGKGRHLSVDGWWAIEGSNL